MNQHGQMHAKQRRRFQKRQAKGSALDNIGNQRADMIEGRQQQRIGPKPEPRQHAGLGTARVDAVAKQGAGKSRGNLGNGGKGQQPD